SLRSCGSSGCRVVPLGGSRDGGWSKRSFDIVFAVVLSLLLAPVMVVCAGAVLLGDGFPILFRQKRVGQHGRPFWIVKFRTMRPAPGAEVTAAGDPRVTRVGQVLRRFKLDELPQLWNVLVGEMSLVGPRPEVPRYVSERGRVYRAVLMLRPGITDFASLVFRDEEELLSRRATEPGFYQQALLPRKVALARLYARRRSLLLDVRLLFATVCTLLGLERWTRRLILVRLYEKGRRGIETSGYPTRRWANDRAVVRPEEGQKR